MNDCLHHHHKNKRKSNLIFLPLTSGSIISEQVNSTNKNLLFQNDQPSCYTKSPSSSTRESSTKSIIHDPSQASSTICSRSCSSALRDPGRNTATNHHHTVGSTTQFCGFAKNCARPVGMVVIGRNAIKPVFIILLDGKARDS